MEMLDMINHVLKQCHDLLDDPNAIKDAAIRNEFFEGLREVAAAVNVVIDKRRELRAAISVIPDRIARILDKSSGYRPNRPRWGQFLGFNAPGSMPKITVVRNPNNVELNRGYQILPPAGIGILRHWDFQVRLIVREIDPFMIEGTLPGRFEWGIRGIHKLALGVRRFDPMTTMPSPWLLQPRFQLPHKSMLFNGFRVELEAVDRFIGDFAKNVTPYDAFREPREKGVVLSAAEKKRRRESPEPFELVPSYQIGQNLANNTFTFERAVELAPDGAGVVRPQERFNFVLIQHQIEWDDLECAREARPLSDADYKKWEAEEKIREKIYEEASRTQT
uniref:MAT1-1-4 n=1 Tax=Eutiarosporella pseudodarliae TaxID=1686410 RepID=A0A2D1GT41_9PEZI|nr:MAT1-1-4 [Eutiarosporella pseudodarliae]